MFAAAEQHVLIIFCIRSSSSTIQVRGARENNLKNISLDIPRRQSTVFTGVSGSGKSSLVFDMIAAESQRLLNEPSPRSFRIFCRATVNLTSTFSPLDGNHRRSTTHGRQSALDSR